MLIPREDGKVRLYIELGPEEGVLDAAGRLDVSHFNVDRLLEVTIVLSSSSNVVDLLFVQIAKKAFAPWTLTATHDKIDWWAVYIGTQALYILTSSFLTSTSTV